VARKRCLAHLVGSAADLAARRPYGCRRGSIQKQLDARFESSAEGLRNPIDFTQVWPRSPARGLERLLGQHTRQPITSSGTADGPTLSGAWREGTLSAILHPGMPNSVVSPQGGHLGAPYGSERT